MAEFRKVATMAEVADGTMQRVETGGAAIALCRLGGAVHATDNTCPHRGGSLGEGSVQNGAIVCPWHAFQFDPKTGRCLNNPALAVAVHPVRVEGQDILVEV